MRFEKWQALGNDYVIFEHGALPWDLTPERVRRLCAPHVGIGADGILLISEADDPRYLARVQIFNRDGSEAAAGRGVSRARPVDGAARPAVSPAGRGGTPRAGWGAERKGPGGRWRPQAAIGRPGRPHSQGPAGGRRKARHPLSENAGEPPHYYL